MNVLPLYIDSFFPKASDAKYKVEIDVTNGKVFYLDDEKVERNEKSEDK